jgi:hypothetical protein
MAASDLKKNAWKTLSPTLKVGDFASLKWLSDEYPPGKSTSNIHIKHPQGYVDLIECTSFLEKSATNSQRLWHIRTELYNSKCENCSNTTKWQPKIFSYSRFCSKKCSNNSSNTKMKRVETNIKKYGTTSFSKTESFKNLYKSTDFIDKIVCEHENKNKQEKKERIHHTKTNTWKQNNPSPFCDPKIQYKIKKTFEEKYGCHPTRKRFSKDTLSIITDVKKIKYLHYDNNLSLSEISNICENYDISSISDILKKNNIPVLNTFRSIAEKEICDILSKNNIAFTTNNRDTIPPYELDILIPSKNIAIEYCGLYWHSEKAGKDKNYHKMKFDLCKSKNIKLITIFEDEWLEKKNIVISSLKHKLGISNSQRIYARKTEIKHVDEYIKSKFFDSYHIQGNGPSSINLALYYNNNIVACMGFIKQKDHYILNRYATSCNVVGGFTKLLNYFRTNKNFPKIITYADLRWSAGDLYEKNGFRLDKIIKPDYSYFKGNNRFHKFNFRHTGMGRKLQVYDPNISESRNMQNNGYSKIYDCGKLKYIID